MPPADECAHFIPLMTDELVRLCCSDLDAEDGARLRTLAVAVQDAHHLRHHHRQTDLKTAYAAFDPTATPWPSCPCTPTSGSTGSTTCAAS